MLKRLSLLLLLCPLTAHAAGLTIFAAASLTDAFKDIGMLWMAQGHAMPTFSFTSSSTLARQIDAGAPADVFASADAQWMDHLAAGGKIVVSTRVNIAGNSLVLVQRRADLHPVSLVRGIDIAALLGTAGRLAVGDPAHVPAGIYAKQALTWLGAWDGVNGRLAPAESVRDALRLVQTGDAPYGIVYATDVKLVVNMAVAGTFPPASHDPIVYPAAVTKHAIGPEAAAFVTFLATPKARGVLAKYGFLPL